MFGCPKSKYKSLFIGKIIVIIFIYISPLFSGNTGKIAGFIYDKGSNQPLIGANLILVGTSLGAATDEDGSFYILQVPPMTYDIKISYMGYTSLVVKSVRVDVDQTTKLNVTLSPETIVGQEVIVIADKKIIQHDVTSTKKTTSRKEIENTPGLVSTNDIFKLQGGVFINQIPQQLQIGGTNVQVRDESLTDIHVRGGRGGEILYMVDGMPVTHPIYGGRNVLDLNLDDVEEVELLTGAFNAEYGQAQSGVVNITTRSGSEKFSGGFQIKSDNCGSIADSYGESYSSVFLEGPEPITRKLLPQLGIKIPGKINYFLSANATMTNTTYNNHRSRDNISILGLNFQEKQDNNASLNGKIDWRFYDNKHLTFRYHGNFKKWSDFNWLWKYYPDHMPESDRTTQDYTVRFNHTLSKSTYYLVNIGLMDIEKHSSLDGKNPSDFWSFILDSTNTEGYNYDYWKNQYDGQYPIDVYSRIYSPTVDDYTHFYDSTGYECPWIHEKAKSLMFKSEITSQITDEHLFKAGMDLKYDDIHLVNIADGGTKLSDWGKYVFGVAGASATEPVTPSGPYKEFGQTRWIFDAYPITGSLFLQDKYERKGFGLIMNMGVRMDWLWLGPTVMDEAWKTQWAAATGLETNWSNFKYKISPRFGISFPISERSVVFFSYGHFSQLPEIHYFYQDPYTGGITGNPHLDYEGTVLYEFGFTQRLGNNWVIDVKSYNKDISDQVGFTSLTAAEGLSVGIPDNKSYQRAKGVEIELQKMYSHHVTGNVTYTLQWANGYASSAFEDYIRSLNDFPNAIRERRVGYDVRHQVILSTTLESSSSDPISLFGIVLKNWQLTFLYRFSSGSPYTPYTRDAAESQKLENSGDKPFTSITDIKFNKRFNLGYVDLDFFIDAFNVLDLSNITGSSFNTETGKPYRYGDTIEGSNIFYDRQAMYSMLTPYQFSNGRQIKFGIKFNW